MFTQPIKRTLLNSVEEIKSYSYRMNGFSSKKMVRWQSNGQIAFADENGVLYVTPYRAEINDMLEKAGYEESSLSVPFSNGKDVPISYQWLEIIANQENWATTYLIAYGISSTKDIKPVDLSSIEEKIHISEIFRYEDKDTQMIYHNMVNLWLNGEEDNLGTYIIINKKTLIICDEYGRTFLLKVKSVINDIVNLLIDAGYRHNPNPARYVSFYEPEEEKPQKPKLPSDSIV